ncbi:MAG: CAP family protein [Flavobacteriales bacterium]|nr:CAP family protein [Flavobacteriales bacterium]
MKILKNLLILSFVLFASSWHSDQSGLNEDIAGALNVHNEARDEVGVNAVAWSISLANDAEEYAKKLAKSGRFEHSKSEDGENLYWYSSTHQNPMTEASKSWYEEIQFYRYRKCCGPNFSDTGHYTQMVWGNTTEIGMGVAVSKSGETYVVARYNPAGNFQGQFPY